ncbi:MAG: hypothetical protein MUF78_07490 [Candidatus Edwardsbacteria bacterium]|nr:hypothetical protein [Candidatus Edwardsbacteria bacterium]
MRIALSVLAALLLSLAAPLAAQDQPVMYQPAPAPALKPFDIGISAGMVLPGTINVEGVDVINSMSPFFKAHLDAYIVEKLAMGIYASYLMITLDHVKGSSATIPDAYNSASGFEIGGTIKPCFKLSETVTLKPGLEIGYRHMSLEDLDDGINGMALGATIELKFKAGGMSPFIAPGFISQPAGGNSDVEVTWAPMITVAGGIEF